jgi:TolB-like protein/Tfp pilus assembly protein PilF
MSFITELRRRNVFRVGVAYAIVAWLLVEVASVVLPTFEAPEWVMKAFTFLVILGFPLTLVIAWAFELTSEGIKREKDVELAEPVTQRTGRNLRAAALHWARMVGAVVVLLGLGATLWYLLGRMTGDPTANAPSIRSLAVLPFANMSGDPEQEYFSDGISEELLNVLAKVKGLRVTSRTSAFAFKGKDISIPEIAEKLGVKHVLEGSVRMAGGRVRITTQLIEVETDSHLWSESYDRELSDIFAVQDEIAAKVGEALRVALLGADSKPIRTSSETSIDVYSDYLLARQKRANISSPNLAEAERLLKGVIKRDPGYAPAYVALASTYSSMAGYGMLSSAEASARMMPLVEQARSLDDGLAGAWGYLAEAHRRNGDHEGARAAEERALEIDPQNPVVLESQISRWGWSHEPDRALVSADELLRIDPLSLDSLFLVSDLYLRLGRFTDMEVMVEHMRSINPQSANYLWGAWRLAHSHGDLVTVLELIEEAKRNDARHGDIPSEIAVTYSDLGDVAAAESWNDAALRLDPNLPQVKLTEALLHLYRNEEAEAVAIARELPQPGSGNRRRTRGVALRMTDAPDLDAGNYEDIITRYLTHFPALADGKFPTEQLSISPDVREVFIVTLGLAAAYLHAGQKAKAESLLSLVETELPHWPQIGPWGSGYGYADVELHALRGDKEKALVALREGAAKGIRYMWRLQLLYNPNLESIRDTPEFAAIVAEIEADMATQLARVREMERNGELEPIPEISATTH